MWNTKCGINGIPSRAPCTGRGVAQAGTSGGLLGPTVVATAMATSAGTQWPSKMQLLLWYVDEL